MSDCIYCEKPAGFLRSEHPECRDQYAAAVITISDSFKFWFESPRPPTVFYESLLSVARTNFVSDNELREIAIKSFSTQIETVLADHVLTEEEEHNFAVLLKEFNISTDDLPNKEGQKLFKAAILRDLESGKVPERVQINEGLSISLSRGESVIWIFNGVNYYTMRTKTEIVGGSQGISLRVMSGVYYRIGAFKAHPVRTEALSHEGAGSFIITNQALYFQSPERVVKIPAKKIIAAQTYSDGIAITQNGANAKQQIFKLDDPWFAANIVAKLNQLQDKAA